MFVLHTSAFFFYYEIKDEIFQKCKLQIPTKGRLNNPCYRR